MKFLIIFIFSTLFLIISACTHVPLPTTESPEKESMTLAKPVGLTADVAVTKNNTVSQDSTQPSGSLPLQAASNKPSTIQPVTVDAIELSLQAETRTPQKTATSLKEWLRNGIQLLENGNVAAAKQEFERVLKNKQQNETALFMLRQIQLTPQQYFAENSFSSRYQAQAGDTFSSIANQFLGDSLSFHSLVKLNQRKNNHDVKAGDIVLVPIAQLKKIETKPVVKTKKITKSDPKSDIKAKKSTNVADGGSAAAKTPVQLEAALVQLKADRIYRAGMAALRDGNHYEAFQAFEKTLTLQPKNDMASIQLKKLKPLVTQFLHDKAMALYKNQKIKAAIGNWDRVLMIDSEHELARVYRGRAIELQERLDKLPKNI